MMLEMRAGRRISSSPSSTLPQDVTLSPGCSALLGGEGLPGGCWQQKGQRSPWLT